MRVRLSYFLSAWFHVGLYWLIAVADDSWLPNYGVRAGSSMPAVSQAARARRMPSIDSRLHSEPSEPVLISIAADVIPPKQSPALPATPSDADERVVLHPPIEELLRRRTSRSVVVAMLPSADFLAEVRTETMPDSDGRAVPVLEWGPIPEQQLPAVESSDADRPVAERAPAPSVPVAESGTAARDALGANTPSGAQTDHNPEKLPENPEPVYPEELRRQRIGGTVLLRVAIRADGAVDHARVEKSSGQPALDAAAVAAVERWRFTPARRAGLPVRVEVRVPITFAIRSSPR